MTDTPADATPQRAFETDPAVYKTLLESTNAIPWKIDWVTQRYTYVGPQIETLLGWPQDTWRTVADWRDRIHVDERDRIFNYCVTQSLGGVDHEADYRALTHDGDWIWVRDVVHVVRTADGQVDSLVGFIFDISERKRAEQEVLRLQGELEKLSYTDGLTGIPNRRMFDQRLQAEWADARRNGTPLSLLLLDIDHFKQYNDLHGHLQGDECLKQVGAVLQAAARRPRDLAARFGGEEFVCLLPDTDATQANAVANAIVEAIHALDIAHAGSPVAAHVTASIGVGTTVHGQTDDPLTLLDAVDHALYAAKRGGRDRIEVAGPSDSLRT